MTLAECLQQAYFKPDGGLDYIGGDEQEKLKKRCWQYGFGFENETELRMALKLDTTRVLLNRSKFESIDLDEYMLNLPGVEKLYTNSGNPMRVRAAGMQKPVVKIGKEVLEKLGFYVRGGSDDLPKDSEKGEHITL